MLIQARYVGPVVMTFMVVFFVTGFITWLNVGISNDFVVRWLRGFFSVANRGVGCHYVGAARANTN